MSRLVIPHCHHDTCKLYLQEWLIFILWTLLCSCVWIISLLEEPTMKLNESEKIIPGKKKKATKNKNKKSPLNKIDMQMMTKGMTHSCRIVQF